MIFLSPQGVSTIKKYPTPTRWGKMFNPRNYESPQDLPWALDCNGFTGTFNPDPFFRVLDFLAPFQDSCLFVVVPDHYRNAVASLVSFRFWAWQIKSLGFPVAFVAQDGQESLPLPPEFDALFVGGSTPWKLSPAVDRLIRTAQARGAWTHVGRVNTQKRIRHFQLIGVDSVDGTAPAINPTNEVRVIEYQINQIPLFEIKDTK